MDRRNGFMAAAPRPKGRRRLSTVMTCLLGSPLSSGFVPVFGCE
jgi:hypothetical protein